MNEFIARHAERITGVLSGFDRLVFRGTLRPISYPEGMMGYLSGNNVRLTVFGRHVLQVSENRTTRAAETMGRAASAGVASAGRRSRTVGSDSPRGVHPERLSESGSPGILLCSSGAGSARDTSPLGVGEPQTTAAPRTRTHPQDCRHLPLPTDGDRTESHHRHTCRAPLNRSRTNAEGRMKFVARSKQTTD